MKLNRQEVKALARRIYEELMAAQKEKQKTLFTTHKEYLEVLHKNQKLLETTLKAVKKSKVPISSFSIPIDVMLPSSWGKDMHFKVSSICSITLDSSKTDRNPQEQLAFFLQEAFKKSSFYPKLKVNFNQLEDEIVLAQIEGTSVEAIKKMVIEKFQTSSNT